MDLVALNVVMPGLSGWDVAQRIHARWPTTSILALTGLTWHEAEAQRWQAAGILYLSKTSARDEVRRQVATILATKRILVA